MDVARSGLWAPAYYKNPLLLTLDLSHNDQYTLVRLTVVRDNYILCW